jgi:hypothetical protein
MSTSLKTPEHEPLESPKDPDAKAVLKELDRILASRYFKDAVRGRQFLEYVVRYRLEGRNDPIKERTIGTEVFHRPAGYQTGDDSVVRVQASEVRRRLEQFYQLEGAGAAVQIELPLGSYSPVFRVPPKSQSSKSLEIEPDPVPIKVEKAKFLWKRWQALAILATGCCLLLGIALWIHHRPGPPPVSPDSKGEAEAQLASFWKKPSSANGIVVAFTNPEFLESNSGQLSPYDGYAVADRGAISEESDGSIRRRGTSSARSEPLYFEDGYTGTGEVFAATNIAQLLQRLNISMNVMRSRAVQASELRAHDIVYLGSPIVNGLLQKVNLPKRFVFNLERERGLWGGEIQDTSAPPSAPQRFKILREPRTHAMESDYGLFQVFPGPSAEHRIILLAGISTTGTQGAAAFATSSDGIAQVRKLLGLTPGSSAPLPDYFECLLRVDAAGGVDALQIVPVSCSKAP